MMDRDKLQMVIDRLEDVDADTLADAAEIAEQDGAFLTRFANLAKQELKRRMTAKDVWELPTADVLVTIPPPKREYEWDYAKLESLVKPLLLPGEWEGLVSVSPPMPPMPVVRVNTVKLNALMQKRRGELQDAILASRTVTETDKPVKLTRIMEVPA